MSGTGEYKSFENTEIKRSKEPTLSRNSLSYEAIRSGYSPATQLSQQDRILALVADSGAFGTSGYVRSDASSSSNNDLDKSTNLL